MKAENNAPQKAQETQSGATQFCVFCAFWRPITTSRNCVQRAILHSLSNLGFSDLFVAVEVDGAADLEDASISTAERLRCCVAKHGYSLVGAGIMRQLADYADCVLISEMKIFL